MEANKTHIAWWTAENMIPVQMWNFFGRKKKASPTNYQICALGIILLCMCLFLASLRFMDGLLRDDWQHAYFPLALSVLLGCLLFRLIKPLNKIVYTERCRTTPTLKFWFYALVILFVGFYAFWGMCAIMYSSDSFLCYVEWHNPEHTSGLVKLLPIAYVIASVVSLIICVVAFYCIRSMYMPNFLVKHRKELLQSDFIAVYNTRKQKFAIVARGATDNRKYGLFDIKELQLDIPFKYDHLEWYESHKSLKAKLGDEYFIIDTNGNKTN